MAQEVLKINKFDRKAKSVEVLKSLDRILNEKIQDANSKYDVVEQRQSYHWENHEKVLDWEDEEHTKPRMENAYDYVEKSADEMTDDDRLTVLVCREIQSKLEAML